MITVKQALDSYYKEHVAVKVVDRRRAEYAIEALAPLYDLFLPNIDIPECRNYREERAGVSDSTVRRELGVLQAAANHALIWKRIDATERPSIELPAEGDANPLWLYKDELQHLLEVAATADRRVFRFCQLAYHVASRKRAIEMLTWPQVSFEPRRIRLQHPSMVITKKKRPTVPFSENIAQELAIMQSKAVSEWVLVTPDNIRPAFDRVAKLADLAELPARGIRPTGRLSPHVLRHSRATHLLQDGKKPWAVANLLGDSLITLLRVYGHACPDYMEDVVN